jgi:alkylhydroperoxidase family enzyme
MILLRWIARAWSALSAPSAVRLPGPRALPAYAAMGRYVAGPATLDPRLALLVRQLAAELSGCRWCIEHGRHLWRKAFFSPVVLTVLRRYPENPLFSERERAALAFTEAVSRYTDAAGGIPDGVLAELRRHFAEPEVAALTFAVAGDHFFNPVTGALGADARLAIADGTAGRASIGGQPRRAAGSAMRNLW